MDESPSVRYVTRPNGVVYEYWRENGRARFRSTGRRVLPGNTVADLMARYVAFMDNEGKAYRTIQLGKRGFELLCLHLGADKQLGTLTKSDLISFGEWCRGRMSEVSVHVYWRAIRRGLTLAREWFPELAAVDLNARWKFRRKPLMTVMDGREVAILLRVITAPWLRSMVHLCLLTGMRLGEVCNLEWSDVDENAMVLRIRVKQHWSPKTSDDDVIPLADDALELLRAIPRVNNLVFPCSKGGGVYCLTHVSGEFKRFVAMAPELNQRIHFHTLRHTFATLLLRAGVGIYEVSRLMRHTSVKTTEIYLHVLSNELHGSVNRVKI